MEFVCLPPNSTDKLQPLDVGIFAPMKRKWREQLQKYAERDPAAKLLMKSAFPGMLKELYESLNTKDHLSKAFERCGLYTINRAKVLEWIPASMQVAEIAQQAAHLQAGNQEVWGGAEEEAKGKENTCRAVLHTGGQRGRRAGRGGEDQRGGGGVGGGRGGDERGGGGGSGRGGRDERAGGGGRSRGN